MTSKSHWSIDAQAPVCAKKPSSHSHHGITVQDDYAWLRADNWQEVLRKPELLDDEIRDYLNAENIYYHAAMADTDTIKTTLFEEMKARIKQDDSSVPAKDGDYLYHVAYETGAEHPKHKRSALDGTSEIVFLDGNKEAEASDYFRIGGVSSDPSQEVFAWSYDDNGSEYYTIKTRLFGAENDNETRVEKTGGYAAWDAHGTGFFYSRLDDNHRPSEVYYHKIGTNTADDRLIFREDDAGYFMSPGKGLQDKWVFIDIHDHETSETWLIPSDKPDAKPMCVAPRETGIEYDLEEAGDVFYILTNRDGAKDFKIVSAPMANPIPEYWQDVVPHEAGRLILSHNAYEHYLTWLERRDGLPLIQIMDRSTGEVHAIAFDEEAYFLGLSGAADYDSEIIRFSYSSMTTPSQVYDYNMRSRERVLRKTQEVPSGHVIDDYRTARIFAKSHDGAEVPVSLLWHKDTPQDGTAPCLLYGYGSYGIAIPTSFNTNALSLVDRGFVYAIAHIRGGKDKGFQWYEDGKRAHKINTFKDFIAAAEHLTAEHYTSHDRIIGHGGSAGGMLMGAVVNMAPEAFGGIIAEVPFVDVLNTMLDATLPLTPPEWPEWGNPIDNAVDYANIAAYSPYDCVAAKAYPPILAIGGLTDPRVTYWEPAKWTAKLREFQTGSAPILMRMNMGAGHGGASGRFARLEEVAQNYAFALKVTGQI